MAFQPAHDEVGHQARVSPIPIGEWVDRNESMMKSDGDLVGAVGAACPKRVLIPGLPRPRFAAFSFSCASAGASVLL
jgi:hypothetical protein